LNYYEALNIAREADKNEIKRAYFSAVKRHSPDSDPEGFKVIRSAYETLYDPKKRAEYDAYFAAPDDIQNELLTARELIRQHKYKQAIEFLTAVDAKSPGRTEIKRILAEALWELRKSGKAEEICKELLEQNPADCETLLLRAKIAASRGHNLKAGGFFDAVAAISPSDPNIWVEYMHHALRHERGLVPRILKRATDVSPDMFRDHYIFYLIAVNEITSFFIFEDPLENYNKFAEFFINDKNMDEDVYRNTMRLLPRVADGKEYVPFLEKILPTIESSRHCRDEDKEDIKIIRANIAIYKLRDDDRIHDVLADLTGFFLVGDGDNDERLGMECYIVSQLPDLRPSIRTLQKEYPGYFKLNQNFYFDVLSQRKTEYLTDKYFAIHKKLLSSQEYEPDDADSDDVDGFDFLDDEETEELKPFVRETPKIGRNDPCPCGSGKKYKKCCG